MEATLDTNTIKHEPELKVDSVTELQNDFVAEQEDDHKLYHFVENIDDHIQNPWRN